MKNDEKRKEADQWIHIKLDPITNGNSAFDKGSISNQRIKVDCAINGSRIR